MKEGDNDGGLSLIGWRYDGYDMIMGEGIYGGGGKVIRFGNVLEEDVFGLGGILELVEE